MIKIKEVAELARVAPSTVSRVLNDHPDVSDAMKARVLKAAHQLGYQPNFLAQSLRTGATRTVGFVVRDISIPLFAGIVKGAEQALESHGYSVLLTNSLQNSALEAKHINVLRQRRVDGLILSLQSESNTGTVAALHSTGVPTVLLDRDVVGLTADAVLFDHATGVQESVKSLIDLGHRRIGLLVGSSETRASRERARGFSLAYEEAGLTPGRGDIVQLSAITAPAVTAGVESLLDPSLALTALVAGDAQLGTAVLASMKERKVRVAADLSLVICDDLDLFRLIEPAISVVSRDAEEMGATAAQILMRRLSDPSAGPVHALLPTNYIARGSTVPPGVDWPKALHRRSARRPPRGA